MTNELRDIIVVDDDPVLLSVLSDLLMEQGYAVRTAFDGFAALAVIRDRVPDILLSDLNMPRMSGFELLSVDASPLSNGCSHRHERSPRGLAYAH